MVSGEWDTLLSMVVVMGGTRMMELETLILWPCTGPSALRWHSTVLRSYKQAQMESVLLRWLKAPLLLLMCC